VRSNAIDRFLRDAFWYLGCVVGALRRRYNILRVTKDGGPESTVWAHWLFECKGVCSVVVLRFENGSRDAYHSHAFDCISWVLSGGLVEQRAPACQRDGRCMTGGAWCAQPDVYTYLPSPYPIITRREHHHKVFSAGRSWVLSFRGPWAATWREELPSGVQRTLASGRGEVGAQ
jgi:hypothetical protein